MDHDSGPSGPAQGPSIATSAYPSPHEDFILTGFSYPPDSGAISPMALDAPRRVARSVKLNELGREEQPSNSLWVNSQSSYDTSSQSTQHSPTIGLTSQGDLIMFEMNPPQNISSQDSPKTSATDRPTARSKPSSGITFRASPWPSSTEGSSRRPSQPDDKGSLDEKSAGPHEETCASEVFYEFVAEDPTIPPARPDRKPRSKDELEQQKESIRLLRKFGGACIWCYRSKKRCGPANPCQPCVANRRQCIRNPDQLHLIGPMVVSIGSDPSLFIMGPPTPAEISRLCRLGDKTFQGISRFHAVINFRCRDKGPGGDRLLLSTWIMEVTQDDAVLSRRTRSAVDQFTSKSTKHANCSELAQLRDTYSDHPLAHTALKMAILFINICSVLKANIHVHPFDMDPGRLTMFLILVVCSQDLAEISDNFSVELCDALRRKDKGILNRLSSKKHHQRASHPLDPVWVATALYYRVVSGLLDLYRTSPAIGTIWGPLDERLSSLRGSLWCILKSIYSSKGVIKDTLDDHIPVLSSAHSFDLAFWLGPLSSSDFFVSPAILKRQGDPFAEPRWAMESFLGDELVQDSLSKVPGTVGANPDPDQSLVARQGPGGTLAAQEAIDNILDPLRPSPWDLMVSMDAVYAGNLGCNFAGQ